MCVSMQLCIFDFVCVWEEVEGWGGGGGVLDVNCDEKDVQ